MELRDYQRACVEIIDGMDSGSGLVSMATGLGKTVIFSALKRKGRVLILSHREELVRQPLKYYDCPCGVEKAEESSHGEEVVSASVQTMVRRLEKFPRDWFDLIITDEAHHAAAATYKKIYEYFRPRLHIGFTATPNRGDRVRLDDVFDSIIFERDLRWGIKAGWLSDARCLRARVSYSLKGVRQRMGDFVERDLDRAVNNAPANREIADIYRKLARGQTLIFAASVSHAENIAAEIKGAVAVSAGTKDRKEIIDRFTRREIPCIVNCMVFTEGTDMPLIETVIVARPTKNASLYAQMVGRGLRLAKGKDYLTIIDCVGVSDDLDICTAPSLMGVDISAVPKRREKMLEGGMLTELPALAEEAADCVENWKLNVRAVALFAEEQGVNTRRINWTKKPNGDLVYQLRCGDRVGVKAMDELGKSRLLLYAYDEGKGKFVYSESEPMSLQSALNKAAEIFGTRYSDEKKLWSLDEYLGWQLEPATAKQLALIEKKLGKEELAAAGELTKGDAAQILNALEIRGMTPARLMALHKRHVEETRAREEENERLSRLKIRYIMKKTFARKYYALRCKDDLIVTDDWATASLIIEELGADNVRFKGFYTKTEAVDFLRGK